MKKTTYSAVIPAIIFAGLLASLSIWNILVPQKAFSDVENRNLAQFPAISEETIRSGEWMTSFESYSSDQFLLRDGFMRIKTAADLMLLRKDNDRVYFGRDGYLFSTDKIDEKQERSSVTLVSDFIKRTKAQDENIRVSFLLAPTAISVLADKLPAYATVSDESAAALRVEEALRESDPDIVFTNPLDALLHASTTPRDSSTAGDSSAPQLYYRTDHHWTTDGAYVAYRKWAFDNGFLPYERKDFDRRTVAEDFYGTNQSKAPGVSVKPDTIVRYVPLLSSEATAEGREPNCTITVWKDIAKPDAVETHDSLYDDSFLSTKDKYAYFLGGNDPQLRIQTDVKNGRRLLLIKDSYANCMLPFLALHYEEIYITDLRYSHGKLILPTPEPSSTATQPTGTFTDVLFLYNIESFSSDRNLAYLTQLNL